MNPGTETTASETDKKNTHSDLRTTTPRYTITPVRTPSDLEAVIKLFREYAMALNIDLSFQSFEEELDSLPGRYATSESGELLIARDTMSPHQALGCVALRRLSRTSSTTENEEDNSDPGRKVGEIKRLYTVPSARGMGLGRALANRLVETARLLEYDELKLDTLPSMTGAQRLYESIGFVDVDPYCFNPVEGTRYLGLILNQ